MAAMSTTKVGQNWEEEEAERSTATSQVKAEAGRGGTHVKIKVRSPTEKVDQIVVFRIKRDVKMGRLMDMYCDKHSISSTDIYFMDPNRGRVIRRDNTPDEIGLEDGDAIFVLPSLRGS